MPPPLASREMGLGSELFPYGTVIIGELKAMQSVLRDTLISGPKNNNCL